MSLSGSIRGMIGSFEPWMVECAYQEPEYQHSLNHQQQEKLRQLLENLNKTLRHRAGVRNAFELKGSIQYSLDDLCSMTGLGWSSISSGSGDLYELEQFFDVEIARLASALFYNVLEYDGSSMALPEESLRVTLKDIVLEYSEVDSSDTEAVSDEIVRVSRMIKSFNALADGEIAKGMENPDVCSFINSIHECFPQLSTSFVADNMAFFLPTIFDGCSDWYYETTAITSKELFFWQQYKDRVPEDLKQGVENALGVFGQVFPSWGYAGDNAQTGLLLDPENEQAVLLITTRESSDIVCDCRWEWKSVFWEDAVFYLGDILPRLRMKYADSEISGSAVAA